MFVIEDKSTKSDAINSSINEKGDEEVALPTTPSYSPSSAVDPRWFELFVEYFIECDEPIMDDLLFFVRKLIEEKDDEDCRGDEKDEIQKEPVFVKRKLERKILPYMDELVMWRETFYLNFITQMVYRLRVSVASKVNSDSNMICHKRVTKAVYASPNRTLSMEEKGKPYECCYPFIYFYVDDFESVFGDIILEHDQMLCVELYMCFNDQGKQKNSNGIEESREVNDAFIPVEFQPKIVSLFQGAVSYSALQKSFLNKNFKKKTAKKISFPFGSSSSSSFSTDLEKEFIMMRGPAGKGHAQVAASYNLNLEKEGSSESLFSIGKNLIMDGLSKVARFRPSENSESLDLEAEAEQLPLRCCLTLVNVSWQSIVKDIMAYYQKNMSTEFYNYSFAKHPLEC